MIHSTMIHSPRILDHVVCPSRETSRVASVGKPVATRANWRLCQLVYPWEKRNDPYPGAASSKDVSIRHVGAMLFLARVRIELPVPVSC